MSLATTDNGGTLAIPGRLTEGMLDTLKATIAQDLTNDELALFAAVCERTGLDPFAKQIYGIKRTTRRKVNGQWIEEGHLTIQTAIDGYRLIAERSGLYGGQDPAEWCGPDGTWTDVWLSSDPPVAARVAVYRKDVARPFVGVARFDAYADRWPAKDGQTVGDLRNLWKTMPDGQIAKCAEALALRKAFPNDLSGIYTTEEMEQANNPIDVHVGERPGIPARDFDELVAASEQLTDEQLAEVKAWCAAEGIALKRAELTSGNAHRVMERILELVRSGGGGSDVPPDGGVPTAPPPPAPSSGGGGAADPAPSAATAPGVLDEPEFDVDGDGQGSPQDVTGGGVAPVSEAREPAVPAPSGGHTITQLETALHQATGKSTLPASKTAILRAAATHGHTGTYDELLADEALTLAVLADLGGTLDTDPPPLDLTPWKQRDEKAWDTWRRAANAKAGPGTKAKPHPRLLDEKPDYDAQRHALAFQASRRTRGEGNEVTSWAELTEAEAKRIWNPRAETGALADIEEGRAVWGFTDEAVPEATGGWWLSQKAKEVAA